MAYSQNDIQWKNNKIGFDTGPSDTIGNYGCYMAAIANVCTWAGNNLNPNQINDLCKQNGWLVSSDLIGRDDIPSLLCGNLQFAGRTNWNDAVSMNFFADASSPDVAYIICIDASKAAGIQTHFVMVWSTLGANDLEIDDSWDGVRKPLSHYGNPSVIIQSATKFIKGTPIVPAPPIVVPEPIPAIPAPATPAPVPPSPTTITPPATAPSKSYYPIKVELPKFGTLTDAIRHTNPTGTIAPTNTTYYQFNTLQGVISITTVPGQPQRTWINPADNVVQPPKPPVTTILPSQVPIGADNDTAWKATYKSFHIDRSSDPYKTMQTIDMKDYSGKRKTVVLDKGTVINVVGTFVKEGVTFYRPRANNDEYFSWYFGVSMYDDSGNLNLVKVSEPEAQKIEQRFSDFLHYWRDDIKNIWDIFVLRRK